MKISISKSVSLFSVTPIGLALLLTGILYFVILGRWVLPVIKTNKEVTSGASVKDYVKRIYGVKADLVEVMVPEHSLLVGQSFSDIMLAHHLYIIGTDTIRGFAVTLFIGIVMSMFTALYVGRMIFESIALIAGWAFLRSIALSSANSSGRRRRDVWDAESINEGFQNVLEKLEKDRVVKRW